MPALSAHSWRASGAIALAGALLSGPALGQVPILASEPTNLASSVDRMISYRHQEHMWQTADGALHVVMNRGRLKPASGLGLHTSLDGGRTWAVQLNWPGARNDSTADGVLAGDRLSLAYSSDSGAIVYNDLRYDIGTRTWSQLRSETVFAPGAFTAENPTVAVDDNDTTWVVYVTTELATGALRINVASRATGSAPWVDTGLVFGGVGAPGAGRSARLLAVAGGMTMIYKVEQTLTWATRPNSAGSDAPWTESVLFVSPRSTGRDPYASHFSIVADSQKNLHFVVADGGKLYYFPYSGPNGSWGTGRVLDSTAVVAYCQISITADDRLMVVYNDASGDSRVMESLNGGESFTGVALLRPSPVDGAKYTYARVETPSLTTLPAPVLRQYAEGSVNKLMLFTVPLP